MEVRKQQDHLEGDVSDISEKIAEQLRMFRWRPLDWRGALVVSMTDARPVAIVHMPGPTLWPFIMSVSFVFLFAGLLPWMAIQEGVTRGATAGR